MVKLCWGSLNMSKKDEKSVKASSFGVNEAVKEKNVFGKYVEKEMFLNHDKPGVTRDSVRPPWDQTLRVREVMSRTDPEFPQVSLWKYACYLLLSFCDLNKFSVVKEILKAAVWLLDFLPLYH